jgi:ribonuclease HI
VINNEIIDKGYKILYDSTNNHGELEAIYLGIQNLLNYKYDQNVFLNLFSDSRISIFGLTKWIKNWVKNMGPDKLLRSSSGNVVKNQDIYSKIINFIVQNNTHLSMYHQLGHKDCNKEKDIFSIIDNFKLYNNEIINEDIAREIAYYNNFIDNTSRNILLKTVTDKNFNKNDYIEPTYVIDRILTKKNIKSYLKLINK